MSKRQIVFGVLCFLAGILVGMEIIGNIDLLVRIIIVVLILLLLAYLARPYLPRWTAASRQAQRMPRRRTRK